MTDQITVAAKLLPCPFCGSSQIKLYHNGKWAGCTQCGAGVSSNTWNTRPRPAPQADEPDSVKPFADRLFEFIIHGDEKHQAWLRRAITAFLTDAKRPPLK